MFKLFKRNPFVKETEEFANSFSKNQKAAIIGSLIVISNITGYREDIELLHVEKCANILHIAFDDSAFKASADNSMEYMIDQLRSLSESQKEWYCLSIIDLLSCSLGKHATKNNFSFRLLKDIGISNDRFNQILHKVHGVTKEIIWKF